MGDKEVLVHEDLDDGDQTVHFPEVRTTATDKKDGDHKLATSGKVTVVDHVEYKNLEVGRTYKVVGRLMDKSTKKEVKVNEKVLTVESKEFTVKDADGSIDLTLTFSVSDLDSGDYVMFEKLYENVKDGNSIFGGGKKKVLVGTHEDINDKAQTVTVPKRSKSTSKSTTRRRVQTGEFPVMPVAGAGAVAALAAGIYFFMKSRKKEEDK